MLCNHKEVGKVINSHFCHVHSEIYGGLQQTSSSSFTVTGWNHTTCSAFQSYFRESAVGLGMKHQDSSEMAEESPTPKPFPTQCHISAMKASFPYYVHVRSSHTGESVSPYTRRAVLTSSIFSEG